MRPPDQNTGPPCRPASEAVAESASLTPPPANRPAFEPVLAAEISALKQALAAGALPAAAGAQAQAGDPHAPKLTGFENTEIIESRLPDTEIAETEMLDDDPPYPALSPTPIRRTALNAALPRAIRHLRDAGISRTIVSPAPVACARRALRGSTASRTSPSSTLLPTRKARPGLPSTAMSAAPRLDGLAITPSRTNRLAATGAAVAVGAAAPSRRATAAGSAAAAGAATEGIAPTEVLDAPPHKRNPHHARLAAAMAHRTSVTRRAAHLLCELITIE
jgi:hypothetical protein